MLKTLFIVTLLFLINKDTTPTIIKGLEPIHSSNLTEWSEEQKQIKLTLTKLLGQFPKKRSSLNPKVISKKDMGTYIQEKISYNVEKNERITSYLLTPKDLKKPAPAVLALHQTIREGKNEVVGITKDPAGCYGVDLVKLGLVVIAPDALTAGERIYKGYSEYDSQPFYKKYPKWSMIGKAIWDNQMTIDYLLTLDFVDKNKIFALGHSEGAIDSLFLAAFDQRITAVALNCGLSTIAEDPDPLRWSRDSWFVAIPALRKYLLRRNTPFDFHQIVALIAPRSFLSFSASEDQILKQYQGVLKINQEASKIYQLYNKPENLNIYIFNGNHSFPENNKLLIYNWFLKQANHT